MTTKPQPWKEMPIWTIESKLEFQLGDLVVCADRAVSTRLFQVWGVSLRWHGPRNCMRPWYFLREIDTETGRLRICPDDRCRDGQGCPICSRGWFAEEIEAFTRHDAEFYAAEKMLHPDLVQYARK